MEFMNMWKIGNERLIRATIHHRIEGSSKPLSQHLLDQRNPGESALRRPAYGVVKHG